MTDNKVKVLVVDDSAFMRKVITDILNTDPQVEVIGSARNGSVVVDKIQELQPSVVTLDVEMPICNGLEALENIMNKCPLPVVMLSSLTGEGAEATLAALELGAIDFIQKPNSLFQINAEALKYEIINKVKAAHHAKVAQLTKKTDIPSVKKCTIIHEKGTHKVTSQGQTLVGIGVSTGGPKALQEVIPYLPEGMPASVFVVQHMPAGFTKSLASRLNVLSSINVKEATHLEDVMPGWVYVAPGGYHLEVVEGTKQQLQILLSQKVPVSGHRPSVDVLFDSLANLKNKNLIGVVMTGMGSDGAKGVVRMKSQSSSYVMTQDEASCIVYGMPKSALKTGVVDKIVPLHKIANEIIMRVGV